MVEYKTEKIKAKDKLSLAFFVANYCFDDAICNSLRLLVLLIPASFKCEKQGADPKQGKRVGLRYGSDDINRKVKPEVTDKESISRGSVVERE